MREKEIRILEVSEEILRGRSSQRDLLPWIAQKWGIRERQGKNYIKEARQLIYEMKFDDLEEQKRLALSRLELLFRENYSKGDMKECRQIIASQADLLGLVPSRFANNEPDQRQDLQVVSRFDEKWRKVSGEY